MAARKKIRTTGPKQPTSRGKRAIVLGVICSDGAVVESFRFITGAHSSGDYHNEMTGEFFEGWLSENAKIFKAITNFPRIICKCSTQEIAGENVAVLVLDNAPYHCRVKERAPRKYNSKKQQLINFIELLGFAVAPKSTKDTLDLIIQGSE